MKFLFSNDEVHFHSHYSFQMLNIYTAIKKLLPLIALITMDIIQIMIIQTATNSYA